MTHSLPYPPPWMDITTLMAHICVKSDRTIDAWMAKGKLPPAKMIEGKRMWKWSEVEQYLEGHGSIVPSQDIKLEVFHATKKAFAGRG